MLAERVKEWTKEWFEEGIEKGQKEVRYEVAKIMIGSGYETEFILEVTGLNHEIVEKLHLEMELD